MAQMCHDEVHDGRIIHRISVMHCLERKEEEVKREVVEETREEVEWERGRRKKRGEMKKRRLGEIGRNGSEEKARGDWRREGAEKEEGKDGKVGERGERERGMNRDVVSLERKRGFERDKGKEAERIKGWGEGGRKKRMAVEVGGKGKGKR